VADELSAVEQVYMHLLHDFRIAVRDGDKARAYEVMKVIEYFERRWPDDVARYAARFPAN
jgi:hypothetical protein